jgi:hypothetical protein
MRERTVARSDDAAPIDEMKTRDERLRLLESDPAVAFVRRLTDDKLV